MNDDPPERDGYVENHVEEAVQHRPHHSREQGNVVRWKSQYFSCKFKTSNLIFENNNDSI